MMSGMLGGKIGPTMAEELVTAAANAALKPLLRIASISMRPIPPMSASAEPDKLAKTLANDRDQLRSVQQSIIFDKAVDFLVSKAKVSTVQPKA